MPSERRAPARLVEVEPESSPGAALGLFLRAIFAHRLVFVAIVVACLVGAGVWSAHRTITYEAHADILVSPLPESDEGLVGLPLIRASELEPQRAAETAAGLLDGPAVSRLAASRLRLDPASVEEAVEVGAVANSSLVEIRAEANSAAAATRIADTFAAAALRVRDRSLEPKLQKAIADTEEQLALLPDQVGAEANALKARLADLRSIAGRGDPTLSLARAAALGTSPDSSTKEVLLVALLAGLLLAAMAVVLIQVLTVPPLDSEAELAKLYPLPVLARVPSAAGRTPSDFRASLEEDDAAVREGFRALRAQLELRAADRDGKGTVLMISPEPDPSRAACSLDLARAFASLHGSAAVLELDFDNPRLAAMVEVDPASDLSSVLHGGGLEAAAESIGTAGVRLVAAPPGVDTSTHEELWARAAEIVEDARALDDWVVVDAAPATQSVADTAAVLSSIDRVVVVVHLGATRPQAIGLVRELFELLQRDPDGYLVVGGSTI